jgi:alpha-galactosidase
MTSPLIFSGDMARLDDFQLNILCNREVIDINQDVLGKQAMIHKEEKEELILIKELENGSKAVGLFYPSADAISPIEYFQWNSTASKKIGITASELGFKGKIKVRDVWRQKDLGTFNNVYTADVPFHGVALLVISEE